MGKVSAVLYRAVVSIFLLYHIMIETYESNKILRNQYKGLLEVKCQSMVYYLQHLVKKVNERMRKAMKVFLIILGILCIFYCISIFFVGFGTRFFLVWSVMGAAFIFLGIAVDKKWFDSFPMWIKVAFGGFVLAGTILFLVVEGMILSKVGATGMPNADYCVILGAQWKRQGPSEPLRRRLDTAVEYLEQNPETKVIVSGGRGTDEIIAEADGMAEYLKNAGIAEDRILIENQSGNTNENLLFSAGLFNKEASSVVIVTNNFHVFRALQLAKKQGYQAEGLAASSVAWMLPNNLLREFVGVLKDFLVGNL